MPPLRYAPTGTSLRSCRRTASSSSRRTSSMKYSSVWYGSSWNVGSQYCTVRASSARQVDDLVVARQQLPHAVEERRVAQHELEGQVVVQRLGVRGADHVGMAQQRLDLRGEAELVAAIAA